MSIQPWQHIIQRDLLPFADPRTAIEWHEEEHRLTATWQSRRQKHHAIFSSCENGEVEVHFMQRTMSYESFLASPNLSDLLGLASMILQTSRSDIFVETQGRVGDAEDRPTAAIELLQSLVDRSSPEATRVVFVTGEAGAGKTEVLRRLVQIQADSFVRGMATKLYLYVDAQGRALARLDEALAIELQDLRVQLTYHSIPSLVRNNLIVPIVDGFDELLGVAGYDDAFGSLRRFLDDLDGRGQLVASARSTYYEQELLARVSKARFSDQRIQVVPVEIMPWQTGELSSYIEQRFDQFASPLMSREMFRDAMRNAFLPGINKPLSEKPFFIAKTADLILSGRSLTDEDLFEQLINMYIDRERTEKLLGQDGTPLLSEDEIREILKFVAEEMWALETRSIDASVTRDIGSIIADVDRLSLEVQDIVSERTPYMAFFRPAQGRDRIEFEHEMFFSYFLAEAILDSYAKGALPLYVMLSRAQLPQFAPRLVSKRLVQRRLPIHVPVDAIVGAMAEGVARSVQARENAGSLLASYLTLASEVLSSRSHRALESLRFENIVFAGISLFNVTLSRCTFKDVEMRIVDLSTCCILASSARFLYMHEVLVDPDITRIELEGFDPSSQATGIRVRDGQDTKSVYRLDTMLEIFARCGAYLGKTSGQKRNVRVDVIEFLDRLMHRFVRSNVLWPSDDRHQALARDALWDPVVELLSLSKVVVIEENRPHQGRSRRSMRLAFLPEQIMAGMLGTAPVPSEITTFWNALARNFPI